METPIGKITHFYSKIYVAVLELNQEINNGDLVHVLGHSTDFFQKVRSMEIDHHPVQKVATGGEVALKVLQLVRKGDVVFKVTGSEAEKAALEGPTFIDESGQ